MANTLIINTYNLTPYMFEPLSNGFAPVDILKETLKSLPFQGEILELHPSHQEFTLGFPRCLISSDDVEGFWKAIDDLNQQEGDILVIQADAPMLDIPMLEEMMTLHHKYYAEYTFADAWPKGMAGELLKPSIISSISKMAIGNKNIPDGNSLFSLIQKDINRFDLETLVAPMDYRPWRLDFSVNSQEGWLLVDRLIGAGYRNSEDLSEWIKTEESALRLIPAYIQIQLTEQCPQACSYCPYPQINPHLKKKGRSLSSAELGRILEQINEINPQATISFSPWGEPAIHENIYRLIENVLLYPEFQLYLETSGIGWDFKQLKPWADHPRITWILSLDTEKPDLYRQLRGEGLDEALSFLDFMENHSENLYCQVVRLQENEEVLEELYKQFQKRKATLILQKYDHHCHYLPERKVTDLSPINRFPCWHNKRDLVIMVDGNVPRCKEDVKGEFLLGNVFKESLREIWARGNNLYLKQLAKEYPDICRNCDEYYTYNL